ncbi:ribose ABC transporter permease [Spirochaetia bacterium]|nr:ribose ABC transporter permease [Spirochaetia bacterium]
MSKIAKAVLDKDSYRSPLSNPTVRICTFTFLAIVVLIIVGNILSPGFGSPAGIISTLALSSVLAIACIGQTLIITSGNGGLDLSIDSMISMGAIMGAVFAGMEGDHLVRALVGLTLLGGGIGLINGLIINYIKVPPFVLTMAMATVVRGAVVAYTGGAPSGRAPKLLLEISTGNAFGHVRWLIVVGMAVTVLIQLLLSRTKFGRGLFLVGTNRNTALLSGVNISFIVVMTYVIAGIFNSMSGFLLLGVVGSATINIGDGYTIMTIAAVVIGGTALSGGKGSFFGAALGAILMIVLSSVLIAVNIPQGMRTFIQGLILLFMITAYTRDLKLRA